MANEKNSPARTPLRHLANCTNREFLKQAIKVRGPLKAWLERTGIPELRRRLPEGWEDLTAEEREARRDEYIATARQNFADMMMAALEKDYDGTVELLCLATFTEPEDFESHTIDEYLLAVNAMLSNGGVKDFFTLCL